ncbi:alpha/beta hydrolase [Nocardioides caeni]|uniref:Alpha/beta hydrolase n=1 Tax=Nocardioides caeni TaxID=574700 RepID=A0A4S8NQE2_9ACTN|nr:alpha/beta hydrolase [Nocardioides caeni]THV18685.1 alpha/beta hydrolase [Nocardioides caeni]
MGFVRRQVVTAALTANAIRPLPGYRTGIPAFFAGWLTGELAPQVLGLTVADAAAHATGSRRDVRGLALAGLSTAGLAYLVRQSRQAVSDAEDALVEGLGVDYLDQLDAKPTPAELATPWRRIANPFAFRRAARKAGVEVTGNIPFAPYGARGTLDVYTSEVTPPSGAPVLLQVHGGGWTIGKKEQQGLPLMQHLAAKGWVCVAINYRLAPRHKWPAQIVDVKAAIAWVKDNIAAYGGDPDYIAITGQSAGGHLTALAAVTPNAPEFQPGFEDADTTVQAAAPYYGVYDLAAASGLRSARLLRDTFLAPWVFGKDPGADLTTFEDASPLLRVTADAPDMFVVHGARDTLVDVGQARAFVEALRTTSKRSVTYAELPGAQHAFDIFPSIRSQHLVRATDRFLHWHWNGWRRERAAAPAEHSAG